MVKNNNQIKNKLKDMKKKQQTPAEKRYKLFTDCVNRSNDKSKLKISFHNLKKTNGIVCWVSNVKHMKFNVLDFAECVIKEDLSITETLNNIDKVFIDWVETQEDIEDFCEVLLSIDFYRDISGGEDCECYKRIKYIEDQNFIKCCLLRTHFCFIPEEEGEETDIGGGEIDTGEIQDSFMKILASSLVELEQFKIPDNIKNICEDCEDKQKEIVFKFSPSDNVDRLPPTSEFTEVVKSSGSGTREEQIKELIKEHTKDK